MLRTKEGGFTLIEVLIVTALMLLLAVCISTAFVQGQRVFERLVHAQNYEDSAFFIEGLKRDLRNFYPYSRIPFTSSASEISFTRLSPLNRSVEPLDAEPLRVTYRFDRTRNEIYRSEHSQVEALDTALVAEEKLVATNVQMLEFIVEGNSDHPSRVELLFQVGSQPNSRLIKQRILLPV